MRTLKEIIVVRQLAHLLRSSLHQGLSSITDADTPEPRHAIENPVAINIVNVVTLSTRDYTRALLVQVLVVGEGVQVVFGIELLPVFSGALALVTCFFDSCHD